jgi:DNA polymerase-3 subunit delta'
MPFADVVGQQLAVAVVRNAIRSDTIAHGYLFAGPEGVGKRLVAMEFAKALNCLDAAARAAADNCGRCDSCRRIAHGVHPDVRVVTLYGRKGLSIGIGHIREPRPVEASPDDRPPFRLERDALLRPQRARCKVYLIDPADRLTPEAQNALLRLLEEPPPRVVLILITAQPASLLPTVLSRCQPLSFLPVEAAAVERHLLEAGQPPEAAATAARLAGGRIGAALRLASPASVDARERVLAILQRIEPGGRAAGIQGALQVADELKSTAVLWAQAEAAGEAPAESAESADQADGGRRATEAEYRAALPALLDLAAAWFRDLLAAQAAGLDLAVHRDRLAEVEAAAGRWAAADLARALRIVDQARRRIERDAGIDLVLTSMVLALMNDRAAAAVWPR